MLISDYIFHIYLKLSCYDLCKNTKKSGVLYSMGLQRVGHDWASELNWTDT